MYGTMMFTLMVLLRDPKRTHKWHSYVKMWRMSYVTYTSYFEKSGYNRFCISMKDYFILIYKGKIRLHISVYVLFDFLWSVPVRFFDMKYIWIYVCVLIFLVILIICKSTDRKHCRKEFTFGPIIES